MASDTRLKLILAAERLCGTHGIHAVPIRDIVEAAGQRNASALNYHFGDREGLVAAVINHRRSFVDTERVRLLDSFERDGVALDVPRIAQALAAPLAWLMREDATGANYVLFLSQVFVSDRLQYAESVRGLSDTGLRRCLRAYRDARPELSTRLARERFHVAGRTAVYALADWHRDVQGRDARLRGPLRDFERHLVALAAGLLNAAGPEKQGRAGRDAAQPRGDTAWT